jgi:hypothetical protein
MGDGLGDCVGYLLIDFLHHFVPRLLDFLKGFRNGCQEKKKMCLGESLTVLVSP